MLACINTPFSSSLVCPLTVRGKKRERYITPYRSRWYTTKNRVNDFTSPPPPGDKSVDQHTEFRHPINVVMRTAYPLQARTHACTPDVECLQASTSPPILAEVLAELDKRGGGRELTKWQV